MIYSGFCLFLLLQYITVSSYVSQTISLSLSTLYSKRQHLLKFLDSLLVSCELPAGMWLTKCLDRPAEQACSKGRYSGLRLKVTITLGN